MDLVAGTGTLVVPHPFVATKAISHPLVAPDAVAIEGSAFAAAVRQSPYAYMAANVVHILSLMIFFSAVAVMDLRLLGLGRQAKRVLPVAKALGMKVIADLVVNHTSSDCMWFQEARRDPRRRRLPLPCARASTP